MTRQEERPDKGRFSRVGLPVAKSYVHLSGRSRLLRFSAIGALAAAALFGGNIVLQRGMLISNGPLSSAHAGFEEDCQSCHTAFQSAADENCSACHESPGQEPGLHSFDAHYIYRSNDPSRAYRRDHETACSGCHSEHRGRDAEIIPAMDGQCLPCHDFGSFDRNHPQFSFITDDLADDSSLLFTHIRHVQNVRRERSVETIEEACLFCHQPQADGKSFQPISFDQHCQSCHLGSAQRVGSPTLDLKNPDQPMVSAGEGQAVLNLGVEGLETVRQRQGPGEQWALLASPGEFRERGGSVTKMRLYHKDPWITHNLRMLRQALYPSAGLADLLQSSARETQGQAEEIYREAAATLRDYLEGLRAQSTDRAALREIVELDNLLTQTEQRIADAGVPLPEAPFQLPERVNPLLSPDQAVQIEELVGSLTTACAKCHVIDRATIARVEKEQRVLMRAEFNHRIHAGQKRCQDCHSAIPFDDSLGALAASAKSPEIEDRIDNAAIQNVPGIDTCRECHSSGRVDNSCGACHRFHADERIESRLLMHSSHGVNAER